MKQGDLVRFRNSYEQYENDTWLIGLLVKYEIWEHAPESCIGTILYDGCLWRIAARDIQMPPKKDSDATLDKLQQ